MIQTFQFNDFSAYKKNYDKQTNIDHILPDIISFVQKGGDLSLPVLEEKSLYRENLTLISFLDFINNNFENPFLFFQELIKHKIDLFFNFQYDQKNNIIIDNSLTPLLDNTYNNFSIETNSPYQMLKIEGLKKIIDQIPNDLEIINHIKISTEKEVTNLYSKNSLLKLLLHFNSASLYEHCFTKIPLIKTVIEKNEKLFLSTLENYHLSHISFVFLKNKLFPDYFKNLQKNFPSYFYEILSIGVSENHTDFFQSFPPDLLTNQESSFLFKFAKTSDMFKLLLEKGLKPNPENFIHEYGHSHPNFVKINLDNFKILIDNFSEIKNLFITNLDNFYKFPISFFQYFLEKEKSSFSVKNQKIDILDYIYSQYELNYMDKQLENIQKDVQWFENYGFNFNYCPKFCQKIIIKRKEGLQFLNFLNKNKIINTKTIDFLFFIMKNRPVKIFINSYESLLNTKNLSSYNLEGYPIWWSLGNYYESYKKNIPNILQTSTNGMPFIYYVAQDSNINFLKDSTPIAFSIIKKDPFNLNMFLYYDNDSNNIFHHLFKNHNLNNSIDFFHKLTQDFYNSNVIKKNNEFSKSIIKLFNEKNNENKNVWDYFILDFLSSKSYIANSFIKSIIMQHIEDIHINQIISDNNQKTLGEILISNFSNDKEFSTLVYQKSLQEELLLSKSSKKQYKV